VAEASGPAHYWSHVDCVALRIAFYEHFGNGHTHVQCGCPHLVVREVS